MRITFTVKKDKHSDPVEFHADLPMSPADTDLVTAKYGTEERMTDRANAQYIVDVARGVRKLLPDAEAAQAYIDGFTDDGKSRGPAVRKLTDEEREKFDPEQLKILRAKGLL